MAEQLMDTEEAYTEHQFMCSECHQLFNTLEDVLIHQQVHTGQEVEGEIQATTVQGVPEDGHVQQFQCLECGSLFVDPEELLQHQEMHMQEAGMEVQQHGECGEKFDCALLRYNKWVKTIAQSEVNYHLLRFAVALALRETAVTASVSDSHRTV